MIYGKIPKSKQKKKPGWKQEEEKYQQHLKSIGINPNEKKSKPKFKELELKAPIIRGNDIPSLNSGQGSTTAKPSQQYTGNHLLGIAVLHKSCLQPVFSQQEATDIAKMRRG